jgi:exopolyphosphatase/guanosine-5'-triphosphate,3'-diphosphate pyrophosphatase
MAAVDLGSNSFHMVIGRVIGGQVSLIDRLREPVRLAAGLSEAGELEPGAVERALACLQRFAERLRNVPAERKRVVGTNTLRRARKAGAFLSSARHLLGVPVEILPGVEEARLIYLGVSHDVEFGSGPRLVVDIGGGSTECILGEGFEPRLMNSLDMGCVSWTQRFFPSGEITREAYRRAELEARAELEPIERGYREEGWKDAIGSSGTVRAVHQVLRASGWSESWITMVGLKRLRRATIEAGAVQKLALPGLPEDRGPVLPGGLAILKAIFEAFELETLRTSDCALREGILYDLHGRIEHEDVRERTVENLATRYHVDLAQAARVELTALDLFRAAADPWSLDRRRATRYLRWAARLVEVGLAVSYSGYHKHSAYLVGNSNLPGFSSEAQSLLALLVQSHRRKLDPEAFRALPPYYRDLGLKLAVLLRLSFCLNRGRGATVLPAFELSVQGERLELGFPPGWLAAHPLTSADLAAESAALLAAGIRFSAA